MGEGVEVIQPDREAYAAYVRMVNGAATDERAVQAILAGAHDKLHGPRIAAFARYRTTSTPPADDSAALREALESIFAHFERETRDGNAPGHGHDRPGIWDDDEGNRKAGKVGACEWCAQWNIARAALNLTNGSADHG